MRYIDEETLKHRINSNIDGRARFELGEFISKNPLPWTLMQDEGGREVIISGLYPLSFDDGKGNDEALSMGLSFINSERVGYLFVEKGSVKYNENDMNYESIRFRVNREFTLGENFTIPNCSVRIHHVFSERNGGMKSPIRRDHVYNGRFSIGIEADLSQVLPTEWFFKEST